MTIVARLWPGFLLALLPAFSQAATSEDAGRNFSFLGSFLQMLAALALVVGLILLVYYGLTRLVRTMPALRAGSRHIRIVEVRSMGPRKALVLVEVGGEYLLLASSGEQLTLVKQINMLEEIEVIDEPAEPSSFFAVLRQAVNRK